MPTLVAATTTWPGYRQADTNTLNLDVREMPHCDENLAVRIKALKKTIPHIDVLSICIADSCQREAILALSTLFPQCKLIASMGVGYNHIDVKAAHEFGIRVTNTPGVLTDATADIALALLLMTTRRLVEGAMLMKDEGRYAGWAPNYMLGQGIQGKMVGIVGFGEIGKAFARRVEALGAKVCVLKTPWSKDDGAQRIEETEFLAACDVVSFHCKLTAESRGWLNAARLAKCKPGVVIINTARGEVIDEEALASALHNEHVSAAGLDVFCNEPFLSPVLQQAPRLIVLPHLGTATLDTRKAMCAIVIKNILAYANNEALPNEVKG